MECLVVTGWDVVFLHQIFGKALGAFDDRCILAWSEDTKSSLLKYINYTANQGIVHTDNSQVDLIFLSEICKLVKFHRCDINTLCNLGDSTVARSTVDLVYSLTLGHTPCNGMLASAAAYD